MSDGPTATKPEFQNEQACIDRLEWQRWRGVPRCVRCGSERIARVTSDPSRTDRWQCNTWRCRATFSIRQGTIFHGSRISLRIWFDAIRCVLNQPHNITASDMARHLGIATNTAGKMLRTIRRALTDGGEEALREIVDEPRATSHEPRATSHEPRATSHEPRATSHEPRDSRADDAMSTGETGRDGIKIPPSHPRFVSDTDGPLATLVYRDPKRKGEELRVLPVGNVRDFLKSGGRLRFRPSDIPFEKGWLVLGQDGAGNEYPVYSREYGDFRVVRSLDAAESYIQRMRQSARQ